MDIITMRRTYTKVTYLPGKQPLLVKAHSV